MENKKQNEQQQIKQNVYDIFTLVKNKKNKVQIAVGNYLVSKKEFTNFKDAEQYLSLKPYDVMINLMCLTYKSLKENENNETKQDAKTDK